MTKRMIIMLVAVGVLFGGLFGFKAFLGGAIRKSISAQGIPPQTVSTAKAQFTEWQGEFQAVGTLRAARGADIAPELSGVITAIHFQSGQAVGAGGPPGSPTRRAAPGGSPAPSPRAPPPPIQ